MNDAQRILDKTIDYFGNTTVEVSDTETSYVFLTFFNPEQMELVRKAFSVNFSSPIMVWGDNTLYGACPNPDIAKDIAQHIQSILDRVALKQKTSPFDSDWISDLLSSHRLGVGEIGVSRERPETGFSISSRFASEKYDIRTGFTYLSGMDREGLISQWADYYSSIYPRLKGRKSLDLLLGQMFDLIEQCLSKDPYVANSIIRPLIEALPEKIIAHNANLEVVGAAETELRRIRDSRLFEPFRGSRIPVNEAFNKKILDVGAAFKSLTSNLKPSDSEPSKPLTLSRSQLLYSDLMTPSLNISEGLEDLKDYIATLYCFFVSKNTKRMNDDLINYFQAVTETTNITGYFSMFSHYFVNVEGWNNPDV